MATRTVRSTGRPTAAVLAGAALLAAVLMACALAGSRTVGAANTESTPTTVSIPPAVHTDLKEAQADLAKLDTAIAREEKQQKRPSPSSPPWRRRSRTTPRPIQSGAQSGPRVRKTWRQRLRGCSARHGQEYQSLAAQVAAIHEAFVQTLTAAGSAYQAAEAATPMP